jgi:CheY-like chemotaxis protein
MQDLLGVGEGFDVATSSNWLDGHAFVRRTQPDLVIVDLMMGRDQTGWAVIDQLRSDPDTSAIPIILCSAAAPALDRQADRLEQTPGLELITKPFDVDQFLGVIERLLGQRPARSGPWSLAGGQPLVGADPSLETGPRVEI